MRADRYHGNPRLLCVAAPPFDLARCLLRKGARGKGASARRWLKWATSKRALAAHVNTVLARAELPARDRARVCLLPLKALCLASALWLGGEVHPVDHAPAVEPLAAVAASRWGLDRWGQRPGRCRGYREPAFKIDHRGSPRAVVFIVAGSRLLPRDRVLRGLMGGSPLPSSLPTPSYLLSPFLSPSPFESL